MKDKTELCTAEDSAQHRPFFARFLEGQETSNDSFMTLKYPSDRDEIEHTIEYMSSNGPQQ